MKLCTVPDKPPGFGQITWHKHLLIKLLSALSVSRPCIEKGEAKEQLRLLVHVDDVVLSGPDGLRERLITALKTHCSMTGGNPLKLVGDTCSMLGRATVRQKVGYTLAGDSGLANKEIRDLGLEMPNPAPTPLTPSTSKKNERW